MSQRKLAKLRVCASCEFIFSIGIECPACCFASYSAHYVYGKKAYEYKKTQEPYIEKKMAAYRSKVIEHIKTIPSGISSDNEIDDISTALKNLTSLPKNNENDEY